MALTPDRTSEDDEEARAAETLVRYARDLCGSGPADLRALDAVEALITAKLVEDPENCRRLLAWCLAAAIERFLATPDGVD